MHLPPREVSKARLDGARRGGTALLAYIMAMMSGVFIGSGLFSILIFDTNIPARGLGAFVQIAWANPIHTVFAHLPLLSNKGQSAALIIVAFSLFAADMSARLNYKRGIAFLAIQEAQARIRRRRDPSYYSYDAVIADAIIEEMHERGDNESFVLAAPMMLVGAWLAFIYFKPLGFVLTLLLAPLLLVWFLLGPIVGSPYPGFRLRRISRIYRIPRSFRRRVLRWISWIRPAHDRAYEAISLVTAVAINTITIVSMNKRASNWALFTPLILLTLPHLVTFESLPKRYQ